MIGLKLIATRNLSVSQNLNKFLTSPLRGSLKICNTTTIIIANIPVLSGILRIPERTGILPTIAVGLSSAVRASSPMDFVGLVDCVAKPGLTSWKVVPKTTTNDEEHEHQDPRNP